MDLYGIGSAVEGCAVGYFRAARHTGRTNIMINCVRAGDTVVCLKSREAEQLRKVFKEMQVNVSVVTVPPSRNAVEEYCKGYRRSIVFDHEWIEAYYIKSIQDAHLAIDSMQKDFEPEDETHMQAISRMKFQHY
jgi:hypothetical protein